MKNLYFILFCILFWGVQSYSQEEQIEESETRHSISIVLSHANVLEGRDSDGGKEWLKLAAWGINYNYEVDEKWAIGLHTDIILEQFVAEGENGEEIERSRPVAPALMGAYKPGEHWSILFGAGGEFSKDENYFLNRASLEYGTPLASNWEFIAEFSYDFRWKAYDSFTLGVGVAWKF
ncbi:hypothetical protein SAMN04487906_0315 [Zhouia amylolytica]|uniref:Outer membrane protein beta-barrel domain-containing protein n=1 Tax=Zhouia amylolytica TaxID=376730 RepID=A0A1I6PI82_9FLAO|nr:hypothetical protein [Zhouia amylolytica]SFS39941.1 hypothetical protein SAMN04487906_0315 [Zhouia amylolytica]